MKSVLRLTFLMCLLTPPVFADTLLSVTGTDNNDTLIQPGESVAVSFVTSQSLSNITISIPVQDLICENCTGTGYLQFGSIGSSASVGNLIDTVAFNSSGSLSLTAATLPAGDYFFVLSITAGDAIWEGSTSPTVLNSADVSHSIDYFAGNTNSGFPPGSDFTAVLDSDRFYQVTSEASAVPENGTLELFLTGIAFLFGFARQLRPGTSKTLS
jgi:hypothetical protein